VTAVTAEAAVTLAWLAPEPPDAEQTRALTSWAHAHGVTLAPARDERPVALPVDPHAADDVERALDRARDAIAARDASGVDGALATAESLLRAHAELPQAAWQMAEVERIRSARLRRVPPVDEGAADRAWARAVGLAGERVVGVGEQAGSTQSAAATIVLDVEPRGATARLDGRPVEAGAVNTLAGPHVLVVAWNGAPVWAAWLDTPAGSSTFRVVAPASPPCSTDDLARAARAGDGVDAGRVRCTTWIAAVPGAAPSTVRIAMCEAAACGPLLDWRLPTWTWTPPQPVARRGWPAWATWSLVGAGAAIATGVLVGAAEALQHPASETRFVSGGVKSE
jgi:hypothetical protein